MSVVVRQHRVGGDITPFLQAAHEVFRNDPSFVPPLDFEIKERLSPKKNPFFKRGEAMLFTAERDGKLVGRISAQVDHEHLRIWNDATGFFGFFDTIDDQEVANALLDAAAKWLKERGMQRMSGPFSLYANEEIGVLVEGFDTPPMLMMAHSRQWQDKLALGYGLVKEKDLLAFRFERGFQLSERVKKAHAEIMKLPEVRLRSIDTSNFQQEINNIVEIYNDTWTGKWGFVPARDDEAKKMAEDLKLVIDPDLAFIAEVNGQAARHVHHAAEPQRGHPGSPRQAVSHRLGQAALAREGQEPEDLQAHDARHPQGHSRQREALRRAVGGHVRRGSQPRFEEGVRVGRALVDTRGRRSGQPRDPRHGRQGLQEVPRLREGARVMLRAWVAALLTLTACAGEPPPPVVAAFAGSAPRGSVPVVVFVDFECPYCKVAHARLQNAAMQLGATLTIRYVQVPLRSHPHATEAAAAQVCAEAQGRGQEAAEALFASGEDAHDLPHLLELARRLELDDAAFATCLSSSATTGKLASDRHAFIEAQFDGVPVLFVGTQKLDGTRPLAEYVQAVKDAQKR